MTDAVYYPDIDKWTKFFTKQPNTKPMTLSVDPIGSQLGRGGTTTVIPVDLRSNKIENPCTVVNPPTLNLVTPTVAQVAQARAEIAREPPSARIKRKRKRVEKGRQPKQPSTSKRHKKNNGKSAHDNFG